MSASVEIPLSGGLVAFVDEADAPLVQSRNWYALTRGQLSYALSAQPYSKTVPPRSPLMMHRLIMGAQKGEIVDHADGDGLNNRRSNLRLCSHAENMRNTRIRRVDKSSRFKGVSLDVTSGRWRVEVEKDGRRVYVGSFKDEEVAARRYDAAARLMFGSFARTNADLGLLEVPVVDAAEKARLSRIASAILARRARP